MNTSELAERYQDKRVRYVERREGDSYHVDKQGNSVRTPCVITVEGYVCGWEIEYTFGGSTEYINIAGYGRVPVKSIEWVAGDD